MMIQTIIEQEEQNCNDLKILTTELDRKGYISYNVSKRDIWDNVMSCIIFMALKSLRS